MFRLPSFSRSKCSPPSHEVSSSHSHQYKYRSSGTAHIDGTSAMSPSSLVQTYESLLLSNLSAIQSIESGLRNITWLLPGRFDDAEVASEACE